MPSKQTGYINTKVRSMKPRLPIWTNISTWTKKIKAGDRSALSTAITLVESTLDQDRVTADQLLKRCIPKKSNTLRLGITGPPGAGKSTFIEYFGNELIKHNAGKIAVLTIDPSSPGLGGSILGDKTRMQTLSQQQDVYIRPSPLKQFTGGVHFQTRKSIQLCEYAGFDIILVETVGVGQAELSVHDITDLTLLLLPPAGGDELQGIKKGITEMADLIVVNKNDSGLEAQVKYTQNQYQSAIHLQYGKEIKVYACSSLLKSGFLPIWDQIQNLVLERKKTGQWKKNRAAQRMIWFNNKIQQLWLMELEQIKKLKALKNIQSKALKNQAYIDTIVQQYIVKLKKLKFK